MKQKKNKAKEIGITKKEIRSKIKESMNVAIGQFEVDGPSKKVKKVVQRASRKIASKIKRDLKNLKSKKKNKGTQKVNGEKQMAEAVA